MKRQHIIFLMIISFCASCKTTKYLKDNECLVNKNIVKFESNLDPRGNKELETDIRQIIIQNPENSRLLFFLPIRRDYLYLRYEKKGWNSAKTFLGKAPTILDIDKTAKSEFNILSNLINNKGFFNANVDHTIKINDKKCDVTYLINTGDRFKINSINYISTDTALLKLINSDSINRSLKIGDFIDGQSFDKEKNRINNFLQEKGYSDFSMQYIDIKGDSSALKSAIDFFIEIYPPANQKAHRSYTNGMVNVYTDYNSKQDTFFLDEAKIDNVRYLKESSDWVVNPKQLDKFILINPGQLSNKSDRVLTYRKMTNLGAYRYVALNSYVDPNDSTKINYDIQLAPHNKLWSYDYGVDAYYSTSPQFKNLLGGILNVRFSNKNAFKGSEVLTLSANVNAEFNPYALNVDDQPTYFLFRTFGYGLNADIAFPRIIDYLKIPSLMNRFGVLRKSDNNKFISDANSNLSIGLNSQNILDFYSVSSYNANFGYKVQNGAASSLNINTLGVIFNDYSKGGSFDSLTNPILKASFVDNFFTSFTFNKFIYIKNATKKGGLLTTTRILGLEVSGLEIFGLNTLYNVAASKPLDAYWTLLGDNFEFSKFIRADIEKRFTYKFGKKSSLAFRGLGGIIVPFGDTKLAPFIRQYNVGGPNSLRGWLPRQMIGGFVEKGKNGILYANQGDLRLEANAEYRFTIGGFLKGGLFVDAGNTWLLKENIENNLPNTAFTSTFYDQIAIAGGYGLRLDFDFFLLRFDFGYKLRNPQASETGRHWSTWSDIRKQGLGNFLIGINYPF